MPTYLAQAEVSEQDGDEYHVKLAVDVDTVDSKPQVSVAWNCTASQSGKTRDVNGTTTVTAEGANALVSTIPALTSFAAGFALCVAGCVGKHAIAPIIECLLTSKGDRHILEECLRSKGIGLAASVLACIIECAAKHPH